MLTINIDVLVKQKPTSQYKQLIHTQINTWVK